MPNSVIPELTPPGLIGNKELALYTEESEEPRTKISVGGSDSEEDEDVDMEPPASAKSTMEAINLVDDLRSAYTRGILRDKSPRHVSSCEPSIFMSPRHDT